MTRRVADGCWLSGGRLSDNCSPRVQLVILRSRCPARGSNASGRLMFGSRDEIRTPGVPWWKASFRTDLRQVCRALARPRSCVGPSRVGFHCRRGKRGWREEHRSGSIPRGVWPLSPHGQGRAWQARCSWQGSLVVFGPAGWYASKCSVGMFDPTGRLVVEARATRASKCCSGCLDVGRLGVPPWMVLRLGVLSVRMCQGSDFTLGTLGGLTAGMAGLSGLGI